MFGEAADGIADEAPFNACDGTAQGGFRNGAPECGGTVAITQRGPVSSNPRGRRRRATKNGNALDELIDLLQSFLYRGNDVLGNISQHRRQSESGPFLVLLAAVLFL